MLAGIAPSSRPASTMSSSYEGANLLIEVDRDVPQSTADSGLTDMEFVDLYTANQLGMPLLTICSVSL